MSSNFYNARLGTNFTQDPRISIMNFISSNWGGGVTPVTAAINFDTKWSRLDKLNHVIVEKMPTQIEPQVLGASRSRFTEYYRIQVYCTGFSAINNKWNIEQEIQRIIQGNVTGIQTVNSVATGIDFILMDQFEEIAVYNDPDINNQHTPLKSNTVARSKASVKILYDKVVS